MTPLRTRLAALALLLATVAACSGSASPPPPGLRVVATTTVLADLVREVGGTRVSVTSLVPKGGVVETFDPRPRDVVEITEARLVVANGLGLDDWLSALATDAGGTAPILRLGEGVPAVNYIEDPETGTPNPHLWLDVSLATEYVARIQDALAGADPAHAATYAANAAAYLARLRDLDAWARTEIGSIPAANRRIVSFHEAFPYFARAYGLEIVGVVVEVPGQDPSAGEVAALVDAIRAVGVKAVFAEAQFSGKLAQAIAEEAGVVVESQLYNDSLGDPPVDTYEGLIRWDVERIVMALGG